jgi:hypothetical protein
MEIGELAHMTPSLAFAAIPRLILVDSHDSNLSNYFEASVPESGDNATPWLTPILSSGRLGRALQPLSKVLRTYCDSFALMLFRAFAE